jgi:hypothetical protein
MLAGMFYTLLIETLQWRFISGRDASLGDLVANSAGTALGIVLALVGQDALHATGRLARRMAGAFAIVASLVVLATTALLQPIGVRYGLSVQWKVPRPNMDDFKGDLQAVSLNGQPLVATQWVSPAGFQDQATGAVNLEARIGGRVEPSVRQAIIVRLASYLEEGLYLGQWRTSVVLRTHQVAQLVRFRPLLVALDEALSPPAVSDGDAGRITLNAMSDSRAVSLTRSASGTELRTTIDRSIGLGWTLILPWDVAITPRWLLVNAAWLGALVLPAAFFTFRSRRHQATPPVLSLWPLVLVVGIIVLVPIPLGMASLGVTEWLGIAAGVGVGRGLEKLIPTGALAPLNPVATNGTIHS